MRKILAAVHDPGAAMMLLPVLKNVEGKARLSSLASTFSSSRFQREGLSALSLPTQLSAEEANRFLEEYSPDLLVTGTSWGSNAEQRLREAAHARKIPSVTVIDYWANYSLRYGGRPSTTDVICVLDQGMLEELVAESFPKENLRVTGHPHLERLAQAPRPATRAPSAAIFLSEPNKGMGADLSAHPFLRIARELARETGQKVNWAFKLHPKETAGPAHAELLSLAQAEGISVGIQGDTLELPKGFPDYDFVAGFQSMGLFEAAAMGLPVSAFLTGLPLPSLATALSAFGISTTGARTAFELSRRRSISAHAGAAAALEAVVFQA